MNKEEKDYLTDIACRIRKSVLRMAVRSGGGHIAPAYSMTDIMAVLYFGGYLKYKSDEAEWKERDYFILSKGHGALALYSVLNMIGFIPSSELDSFCRGGNLGSLAKRNVSFGIEATTGSLGHGLSYAVGIALALKKQKMPNKVYVILGDGECEEGSVWEALMAGVHHKLDNLTVIIDNNDLQGIDTIKSVLSLRDLASRLSAFGYDVIDINGHNYDEIDEALNRREENGIPRAIVAHTIKGKGISFMEGVPIWHYRVPNDDELEVALKELNMGIEELGDYEKCIYRHVI